MTLFAKEVKAIEDAVMWMHNSDYTLEPGDPRNLDPEDEPLDSMRGAAYALEEAADDLMEAVRAESSRREAVLDEMPEEELAEWEAKIAEYA